MRLLFLSLLVLASGSRASAAEPEDWPCWRGPRGDGTWQGPRIATKWPNELTTVWKRPISGGYSGVSVVGDRVYVMDRQKEPEVERVLCLNAADGEIVWSHTDAVEYGKLDYGNGPRAAPTVHKGRVYTLGALGHLNCLDAATGERIWSLHLEKDFGGRRPDWGYSASPCIQDDRLIIQPGGTDDASIVALDPATGKKLWGTLGDQAGYTAPITIRAGNEEQLVCWTPSHIRAVEPKSGKPLWDVPYEITYGVAIATPIYHKGLVIVCGYWHGSKGIRPGTGGKPAEVAWEENRFLRGLMSQPLTRGEHVYLLDKQYGLTCFEAATGKKLWDDAHRMTPRGRNPHASIVQLAGSDRILALNADGELVLADLTPEGYTEHARAKVLGETWAHPAFAGRRVYARSDSEIVCVELPIDR
jgi:outer membrane protein assembly factor BamB